MMDCKHEHMRIELDCTDWKLVAVVTCSECGLERRVQLGEATESWPELEEQSEGAQ